MLENSPYLDSYKDAPWCSNPKAYQNIVHEDDNIIVFKDRYPVTQGHLLYVPKEINKEIKKNISHREEWIKTKPPSSKMGDFFIVPCAPLMELIHPWLYECQIINNKVFGYDIHWDFHLDTLNYNVYGMGGEYGWHLDANGKTTPHDVKLTCLLNLSEESYEGGEFYTIGSDEKVKFDSGMGLVLNSLIAHKVTPVTKGERITLTYWAVGPSWR